MAAESKNIQEERFVESVEQGENQLAGAVQQALLNCEIPQCRCGRLVVKNRMTGAVGGDFYHFRTLGPDQFAFAIGDVMGHGNTAALIMSLIIGVLRADRIDNRRPERVVVSLNDMLLRLGEYSDNYIICSLIYGIVDIPSGILFYINAGHPHPIVHHRTENRFSRLPPTAMVLGVQSWTAAEQCHQFQENDRLLLFTDGIIETRNENDEFFGENRLRRILVEHKEEDPEKLANYVFDESGQFAQNSEQKDDQTLVVVDFNHPISRGF
jgi:phosphoserine phosphatase RsbU/P